MTTRRSLFAIFAAGFCAAFGPADSQAPSSAIFAPAFTSPRGQIYLAPAGYTLISTGNTWVLLESPVGEAIARGMAVNLRSDGSIRHRQHHPTDFPRGRQ